jgi:hypothetical protein
MQAAIQIEGGAKLRRAFRDAEAGMEDLKDLHKSLADDVAGTAKTKVPVRTGRLQRSIRGSGTKTAARVRAGNNRASGATAVPYGPAIHFGWSRRGIKPQPFLYEALDDRRQDVINDYNAEIRHMIKNKF